MRWGHFTVTVYSATSWQQRRVAAKVQNQPWEISEVGDKVWVSLSKETDDSAVSWVRALQGIADVSRCTCLCNSGRRVNHIASPSSGCYKVREESLLSGWDNYLDLKYKWVNNRISQKYEEKGCEWKIFVPLNISETLNVFSCFKGSNWKMGVGTNI